MDSLSNVREEVVIQSGQLKESQKLGVQPVSSLIIQEMRLSLLSVETSCLSTFLLSTETEWEISLSYLLSSMRLQIRRWIIKAYQEQETEPHLPLEQLKQEREQTLDEASQPNNNRKRGRLASFLEMEGIGIGFPSGARRFPLGMVPREPFYKGSANRFGDRISSSSRTEGSASSFP